MIAPIGPKHPITVTVLTNLADNYRRAGSFAEAEPLYRRALPAAEEFRGSGRLQTAIVLEGLAEVLCDQNRYADAEPIATRALVDAEKIPQIDDSTTAEVLDTLSRVHAGLGKTKEAEAFTLRARTLRKMPKTHRIVGGNRSSSPSR